MGTDKALLVVDGTAMARRVADALLAGGVTVVRCIGGDGPALTALGLSVVADQRPGMGPLGGVHTAMHEADRLGADVVVVSACDHPDLDGPTVAGLVGALGDDPGLGYAVAQDADGHRPLIVALRRTVAEPAAWAGLRGGDRSMHAFYIRLEGVAVTGLGARPLQDVDQPTDLDKR